MTSLEHLRIARSICDSRKRKSWYLVKWVSTNIIAGTVIYVSIELHGMVGREFRPATAAPTSTITGTGSL